MGSVEEVRADRQVSLTTPEEPRARWAEPLTRVEAKVAGSVSTIISSTTINHLVHMLLIRVTVRFLPVIGCVKLCQEQANVRSHFHSSSYL